MTLPACTIPLFAVVAGIAATLDSVTFAALAGLLFGSLFTLPMVVSAWLGLHEDGRELLNRAAQGSPYLTAVLLFGAALYLLVPSLGIDTEMLKATLQHASWAVSVLAFWRGSFSVLTRCLLPLSR